ncbi:MAG: hypothetical protein GY952_03705 [Rhodobacteraceae bacterium]|nr:hypothetical protein [Paracoccaceae bacterium]
MGSLLASMEKAATKLRRKRVSRQVFEAFGGMVRYGPFAGLKLGGDANTSSGNLGAKVCGLYEQTLLNRLKELGPFQDVVNFGAADGYFSIGLLIAGQAKRSICFEMTEQGQAAIARNAAENGVQDAVEIRGIADDKAGPQLRELGFDADGGLVLCDIEGAEFFVLSEIVLNDLKGAVLVVELHDRLLPEGLALREALIARLPEGANHEVLISGPPDWRGIPEIETMSDYDRALVSTDGRKVLGEWLIVSY